MKNDPEKKQEQKKIMAIAHVVVLKVKPDAPAEKVEAMLEAFRNFSKTIADHVVSSTAGVNFSNRSLGFTHVGNLVIKSKEAIADYLAHPVHVAFVEDYIKPLTSEAMVLDYDL